MKTQVVSLVGGIVLATTIGTAKADEFTPMLQELADAQIKALVNQPEIVAAIQAQNGKTAGMGEADVVALDNQWRGEVGGSATPTIDGVLNNAVADMLRQMRDESEGLYTEIFVMDAVGLNVAASDTTSDYWQGDEAKWQQSYAAGSGAVHISDVELDESTQSYQAQVSVSISDDSGAAIGAATFGVNVDYLQ